MIPPEIDTVSVRRFKNARMRSPVNRNSSMMIRAISISRISTTRRRFGSRCFKTDIKIGRLPSGSIINNNNIVAEIISVIGFAPCCSRKSGVISYAAEKVSVIELIHLLPGLHFVE